MSPFLQKLIPVEWKAPRARVHSECCEPSPRGYESLGACSPVMCLQSQVVIKPVKLQNPVPGSHCTRPGEQQPLPQERRVPVPVTTGRTGQHSGPNPEVPGLGAGCAPTISTGPEASEAPFRGRCSCIQCRTGPSNTRDVRRAVTVAQVSAATVEMRRLQLGPPSPGRGLL